MKTAEEFDRAKNDFLQTIKALGVGYREALIVTFHPVLTSEAGLHDLAKNMGVVVLPQDKHVAIPANTPLPYAIMGGDRIKPSLQILFQKVPEKKLTMQGNLKQGLVVWKGRCSIIAQHVEAFLALCGPVVKVNPFAQAVKRKVSTEQAFPGKYIRDLFLVQNAGAW